MLEPRPPDISRYSAVIFDLFHTLTSMTHQNTPGTDTSVILGVPPQDWYDAVFHRSDERLRGLVQDPEKIIAGLLKSLGLSRTPEKIKEAAESRARRFRLSLKTTLPHTRKALKALKEKGIKLALCSNADFPERVGWDECPLAEFFDVTVFSCDVGFVKPEREIYDLCLGRLGETPGKCLFVGDGGSNELIGARNAGLATAMTSEFIKDRYPERVAERLPQADFHITCISQLTFDFSKN